jgi:hypothetical protein
VPHPLDGARLKLDRARAHLRGVDSGVAAYLGTQPVQVEDRQDRDGNRRHIQWIATAAQESPPELGVIVGEWAHNVRGALDYTVYELVRRETGEEDPRWTQFPIVLEEPRYADQERQRLRSAPDWALPVFRGLQPFNDGDEAAWHPLAILGDISNRDKHRLVHTAAMQIAGSQARVSGTSMLAIHRLAQNPGTVEGERVILDAVLDTDGDDLQIELNVQVSVALERYEIPITGLLEVITEEATSIVEWFAPAFD